MKEKSSSLGLKRSKYTTWVLSIVLFFILVASVPAGVVYASSLDTMVPSDTNTDANYNRYGVSHYSFQTLSEDHHFWQVGAVAKDGIVGAYDSILSATFLAIVQITRFFNFVSREAFTFSMMDALIDGIAEIIRQVTGVNTGFITSGGLFDSLGGIAVMITAAYILWLMVKTRFLDGMQQAFSFLIALIVIIGFFANAGPMLKGANNAVSSVGTVIYSALAKATGLSTNSANGVVIISEQVWNELVIRPYTMLQFDSSDLATKDPVLLDQVLKSQPFSDERQAVLASAASKYPAVGQVRSSEQMIMILVFFIFSAIILGLFTYWAILTIFMRFKLLSHAAVMSVTLIGALLPGREAGVAVLRSQFTKLIGYVVMTAMTMFMLDLSLVMGHFTYDVVFKVGKGWFLALFLESIMIFVIFKYRNEITQVFGKATGIPSNLPRPKSTVADALQRNVTRTLYNTAANKVGGLFNRRGREGVPASFSPSALSRAHNSLNDATSASMMLRYQREREAAESMATEEGQEVQHTPFVQRVNENLRNGAKNPFRGMDKEWKEEQQRLKNVQDDKGNMKEAILTQGIVDGMNDQEAAAVIYGNEHAIRKAATYMVERPKRVGEQMARAKSLNRDHQLKTSVDDFCMIQLFDRYKVDYKQAVEASHVSGDPVKHSDFVKNMDARFGEAGLNNTTKVNNTMLHRNSRISIAPMFEDMPEFQQVKMKLLHANEALRRISPPTEGVELPLPVHLTAPISTQHLLSQMPKVSSGDIVSQMHERSAAIRQSLIPTQVTPIVNMPESYLRKPAARLENDIKNVAPLASIQQLPLSTEHVKASLPRLPKNTIAGQIEKQRRELHEQLVQSLPVQDTSAQLIPSPRVAITGLIHPKVIQLPKLSSGGIRQQLMDQKNSIVRQAFQESRLSVDAIQQRGKHMFPTQKKPSQQHLGSRSTIQNETSVQSRFKVIGNPKGIADVQAVQQESKHLFSSYGKMPQQHLGSRSTIQNETSMQSRFKVIGNPKGIADIQAGSGVPPKLQKNVQITQQTELKRLNPVVLTGSQTDVRVIAKKRLTPQIPKMADMNAGIQASKQVTSTTVSQEQLQRFRINRSQQTKMDLKQVRINDPRLKMFLDHRDHVFPELFSNSRLASSSLKVHKDSHKLQVNTKAVQFKDSSLKASMEQSKAALLAAGSTSSVSTKNIQARKLYKVNVNRVDGLKVNISDPAPQPKLDPLLSRSETVKQTVSRNVNLQRKQITNMGIKSVNFKNAELKFKVEQTKAAIVNSSSIVSTKIETKPVQNLEKAMKLKQKVSPSMSDGLEDELKHLKTMERARRISPVSTTAENISKLVQSKAQAARQSTVKTNPGEPV